MRAGQLNLPASPSLASQAEEEIPELRRKAGMSCSGGQPVRGFSFPGWGQPGTPSPWCPTPSSARIWSEQEAASWGTREGSHKAGQ